jgi:hypothetical protein
LQQRLTLRIVINHFIPHIFIHLSSSCPRHQEILYRKTNHEREKKSEEKTDIKDQCNRSDRENELFFLLIIWLVGGESVWNEFHKVKVDLKVGVRITV